MGHLQCNGRGKAGRRGRSSTYLHLVESTLKRVFSAGILADLLKDCQLLWELQLQSAAHAEAGVSLDWHSYLCKCKHRSDIGRLLTLLYTPK